MIKKFKTIQSMAVFQDFHWDAHVKSPDGNVETFKKINILYGRNYSGKTTLSRIIRALETEKISEKYHSPQFSIMWDADSELTQNTLVGHGKTVRVFNEDFVRDNLSYLVDPDNGMVTPFAVIGADNVKIEGKIRESEAKLGSEAFGSETGLYAKLRESRQKKTDAQSNLDLANNTLEQKMTQKATSRLGGIKYQSEIFGDQNYTIAKLRADITTVLNKSYTPIDDAIRQEFERSLKETAKNPIPKVNDQKPELQSLCDQVKAVVEKTIGGSEKIQELLLDHALSEWVKKGCEIHDGDNGKRPDCAFCGSEISSERWHVLEKHFDEESKELEQQIKALKELIQKKKIHFWGELPVSKDDFYSKFHSTIDVLTEQYRNVSTVYCEQLNILIGQLDKREQSVVQDFGFAKPTGSDPNFTEVYERFNAAIDAANAHTASLSGAKQEAQSALRLNEVWKFANDINYTGEKAEIESLEEANRIAAEESNAASGAIKGIKENIESLKRQMNDEEKGSDRVNEYLKHFGHESLSLKARSEENPDGKQTHFDVVRGVQKAFHLSEGECSLISFCYFMAKLDDVATDGKKAIIWIDDPISSLDSNHVFFVYSLLRSEIIDKEKFEQLFISTHNLDFLKYLKRLKNRLEEKGGWFIVERRYEKSVIKIMPTYLKKFITEFNYLFEQIYKCQVEEITDRNYEICYHFGNNARKFLEIYLYYRFPDMKSEDAMVKFFGAAGPKYLVDRINNEYSHLLGPFERGSMPVDVPEMQLAAKQICERLKATDREQYNSLIRSVGGVCEEDDATGA